MDPRGEARVPFEQPQPAIDVAQQLDLGASRPPDRAHGRLDRAEQIGRHFAHVARPGLAVRSRDALAHVDRIGKPPVESGEAHRLLVAAHMSLYRDAIGLPAVLHPGAHLFEVAPVPDGHGVMVGTLDPHPPGMRAAEGVDRFVRR